MEMKLPIAMQRLLAHLEKLPSVGHRTALRHVNALMEWKDADLAAFADELAHLHERVFPCPLCGNYTDEDLCPICASPNRDPSVICVVETPSQIEVFERTGCYRGLYHVLGGRFSPLSGVGPEQLRCKELRKRLEDGKVRELILATSTDVEGEATAHFLASEFRRDGLAITRLAVGVPTGADLAYADSSSLAHAIEGRRQV